MSLLPSSLVAPHVSARAARVRTTRVVARAQDTVFLVARASGRVSRVRFSSFEPSTDRMRLPLLLALLLASLATADGDGFDAAALGRSGRRGGVLPPAPRSLRPHKAHVSGGARVTITGSGFRRGASLAVRFASENAVDVVPAVFISKTTIECVAPRRDAPSTAHVSVTNGDGAWSAHPLVYVRGAGAPLTFVFDDSPPGCQGCGPAGFQSSVPIPDRVRERWTATESVGADVGGTPIVVSAVGLRANDPDDFSVAKAFDDDLGVGFHRYAAPGGGFGTRGRVDRVDPTSTGNGPPVTGTFYPGDGLTCRFSCPLSYPAGFDFDALRGGAGFASAASPRAVTRGADANLTAPLYAEAERYAALRRAEEGDGSNPARVEPIRFSADVAASWIDYDRARCVSPPRPTPPPALAALGVNASRDCFLTISNDGDRFDDASWLGGEGGATPLATRMGNAASVPFRYDDRIPIPTSAESSHAAEALRRRLGFASRGPFAGGTEVTIRGEGFLRGDALSCRFEEDASDGDGGFPPATTRARFVDARTIACVSPPRPPRTTSGPSTTSRTPEIPSPGADGSALATRPRALSDLGRLAPCFASAVRVSNDGVSWSAPADAVRHLYCDVYVHPAARHVDPERACGTPDRPFPNVQSAFSATLRDARLRRRDDDDAASPEDPRAPARDRRESPGVGRARPGVRSFGVAGSRATAARGADAAAGGAYSDAIGAWLDVDVVRLAPGAYGGEGDVRLAVDDGKIVRVVVGDGLGDEPDAIVARGERERATIDCREDGYPAPLFASSRVRFGAAAGTVAAGTDGRLVGGAVVTASRVDFLGCYHADGEHEAVADGGCAPDPEGAFARTPFAARGAGGCRGDDQFQRAEAPGFAVGAVARDPTAWEQLDYDDALGTVEDEWYEYEP